VQPNIGAGSPGRSPQACLPVRGAAGLRRQGVFGRPPPRVRKFFSKIPPINNGAVRCHQGAAVYVAAGSPNMSPGALPELSRKQGVDYSAH